MSDNTFLGFLFAIILYNASEKHISSASNHFPFKDMGNLSGQKEFNNLNIICSSTLLKQQQHTNGQTEAVF